MPTLGGILNTGRQALQLQQLAMQIIGHNTSNVSTEGYSRRRIDFSTAPGIAEFGQWQIGSGVDLNFLGRIRDRLLDDQIWRNSSEAGYWSQQDEALGGVEQIFSEMEGTAISDQLKEFWASWQDLANNPEGTATRQSVLEKAQSLASGVRRVYSELAQRREDLDAQIVGKVGEVNQLTAQIAQLNVQIAQTEQSGGEASDLRDARDLAVGRLSSLIQISVQQNENGAVSVYASGQVIVQGDRNTPLTMSTDTQSGYSRTSISLGQNSAPISLGNGEIKSLMDTRDTEIGKAMQDLDTFAQTLATRLNEVHRTGYGLSGSNGMDFFDPETTGAANFQVSSLIAEDVSRIATAASPDATGDNSIVLQIAAIQQEKLLENGQSTIDDFYTNSVIRIGSRRSFAADQYAVAQAASDHLENRRLQISGVSMDEEMTRLIQVQQAYDAAAKIIKTVDEMMTTILDMKQ
jgi:flagellar hook-associated protein 1 FlgK